MSTEGLYEQRERKTRENARKQGLERGRAQEARRALALTFKARFGPLPAAIAEAIEATDDTETLERWIVLCASRSQEEVAAAVLAERPAPAS